MNSLTILVGALLLVAIPYAFAGDGVDLLDVSTDARQVADTFTLAVLADLHVDADNVEFNRRAVDAINALPNVDATAILGDICHRIGTASELKTAAAVIKRLERPAVVLPGNHDYLNVKVGTNGKRRGTAATQKAKLERFRRTFGMSSLRRAVVAGGHLLVFLPTDGLEPKTIVTVSEGTLHWLRRVLTKHRDLPTVVFTHAPLKGSFTPRKGQLSVANASCQPAEEIASILKTNPQVFLWVAGHRHSKPSAVYRTVGKVHGLPVPTVHSDGAWVRVLTFSADGVKVRTLKVGTGAFVTSLERTYRGSTFTGGDDTVVAEQASDDESDDGAQAQESEQDATIDADVLTSPVASTDAPSSVDETATAVPVAALDRPGNRYGFDGTLSDGDIEAIVGQVMADRRSSYHGRGHLNEYGCVVGNTGSCFITMVAPPDGFHGPIDFALSIGDVRSLVLYAVQRKCGGPTSEARHR